jgi:hypothetical protein
MPADIVQDLMQASMQQEKLTLMDDYGTVRILYVAISQQSSRGSILAAYQASMVSAQSATEAYAASQSPPLTLPTPLTLAQKQALFAAMSAPASTTNTVTSVAASQTGAANAPTG